MSAKATKLARIVDELERTRATLVTLAGADESASLDEALAAVVRLVEELGVRGAELEAGIAPELERLRGAVRLHQRDTVRTLDVVRAAQRFRHARGATNIDRAIDALELAVDAYEGVAVPDVPPEAA